MTDYRPNDTIPTRLSASWCVIVTGSIVWTGGLARARREATRRGGMLRPSVTVIKVTL